MTVTEEVENPFQPEPARIVRQYDLIKDHRFFQIRHTDVARAMSFQYKPGQFIMMSLPGVVSVGIGRDPQGNPAVIVGMDSPRAETQAQIPTQLDGYPLLIQIVGPLKAQ